MVFFLQAEDGIRDMGVTGVQTCALPIWSRRPMPAEAAAVAQLVEEALDTGRTPEEVCADAPHLLERVRARWELCRRVAGRSGGPRVGEEGRSWGAPDH